MGDNIIDGPYTLERLSDRLFKIVENDRFGQYPFIYVIVGDDKVVLIDTGVGTGDLRGFIEKYINQDKLPYLVFNTHIHYDHIGGNYMFSKANAANVLDICMGDRNVKFSQNPMMSLAIGVNYEVKPFEVTRWVKHDEVFYLNDTAKQDVDRLVVWHIPGHCEDHIAVWSEGERRLFVGDTVYPFTALDGSSVGSNLKDYLSSLEFMATSLKSMTFDTEPAKETEVSPQASGGAAPSDDQPKAEEKQEEKHEDPHPEASTAAAPHPEAVPSDSDVLKASQHESAQQQSDNETTKVETLLSLLDMDKEVALLLFDPRTLLSLSDGDVEGAVNLFYTLGDSVSQVAPPGQSSHAGHSQQSSAVAPPQKYKNGWEMPAPSVPSRPVIAGGHVDPALELEALEELITFLQCILSGAVEPTKIEAAEGVAEYSNGGRFTIILPHPLNTK